MRFCGKCPCGIQHHMEHKERVDNRALKLFKAPHTVVLRAMVGWRVFSRSVAELVDAHLAHRAGVIAGSNPVRPCWNKGKRNVTGQISVD